MRMICPKCGAKAIKSGLDYKFLPPRQKYRCCLRGGCRYAWTGGYVDSAVTEKGAKCDS